VTRRLPAALALALLTAVAGAAADDPYGDPLPAGAKARLGTARLRAVFGNVPTAITPDGTALVGAATSEPGTAFTDLATGKVARAVPMNEGPTFGFSADGRRGAAAGYRGAVVWDARDGKVVAKVARPLPSGEYGVALSADGKRLAVGGAKSFDEKEKDKPVTAVVWDVDADKQLASVAPAQNQTVFVALSADGRRLATWGYHSDPAAKEPPKPEADPNRLVQFWDAATGKKTGRARMAGGFGLLAVALSPDGTLAAVSGGDGSVHLFDVATGAAKGQLLGRSGQGARLVFGPDGKVLAAGGADGSVQRWSVPDGKRLGTTECPVETTQPPRGIQFTGPDRAVAWSHGGVASFAWEVPSGKLLSPAGGLAAGVTGVAVVGGGAEVLTAAGNGEVVRWDASTGKERGRTGLKAPGPYGRVSGGPVALSADGTRALVVDGCGVYDLPAGAQQFVVPGGSGQVGRGAFTPDGAKAVVLTLSFDRKQFPHRAAVWDVAAGRRLGGVEVPGASVADAALTPDGKTLVTAALREDEKGGPGELVVAGWELATGKKRGEYAEPGGFGRVFVAAAGDNATAVVTTPKGGLAVIDVATGKKVRDVELGGRRASAAPVVGPDGKTVAVALEPQYGPKPTAPVLLVDVATGKVARTLEGATGVVTAVAFSPDGKTLVTGSNDTTALVWDLTGK
jgi:WD40 repeat protein